MESRIDHKFKEKVYAVMALLPRNNVTTYGDVATLAGSPRASRVVGGIAHYGLSELPWHRLVNRYGGLARGFPGGPDIQRQLLEQDGITCTDFVVDDFAKIRWRP